MLFEIVTASSANLSQTVIEENNLHVLSLSYYIEDPYFIKQLTYSKLVYSHDTALFLNDLSNRNYQLFLTDNRSVIQC